MRRFTNVHMLAVSILFSTACSSDTGVSVSAKEGAKILVTTDDPDALAEFNITLSVVVAGFEGEPDESKEYKFEAAELYAETEGDVPSGPPLAVLEAKLPGADTKTATRTPQEMPLTNVGTRNGELYEHCGKEKVLAISLSWEPSDIDGTGSVGSRSFHSLEIHCD